MKGLHFLQPARHTEPLPTDLIDPEYRKLRLQVFIGILVGYAGYYFVRKAFSFIMPDLLAQGYTKSQLGVVLSAIAISYGISKFVMGTVSDRSNARVFLSLGLVLSAMTMIVLGAVPLATGSVAIMFIILFLSGWFQGMGWPPCGRVVVHWFSTKERGRRMSVWNISHNIGAGVMAQLTVIGFAIFGSWQGKLYFPAMAAIVVAVISYMLVRDTPQSCGLPPIETYKPDAGRKYDASHEKELSTKQILLDYVLVNKMLWYIAVANAFIYLVRYGVLDWAPTYLKEAKGFSLSSTGWAYFLYEWAGIPGTLLAGWLSDKVFQGRRAPVTILFMVLVAVAVLVYWKNPPGNPIVDNIALISIGFLIYGPVMLIGVQALDLVPKKAAGTAAGLTGFFGYICGTLTANAAMGYIIDAYGWDGSFIVLFISCLLAIVLTALTWKREQKVSNHS